MQQAEIEVAGVKAKARCISLARIASPKSTMRFLIFY
jgi:hypothetical protein